MTEYLPFLVVGITSGSLYGLAGVGLVLTYRTSGVFNFAHGAVAAVGAFVFYELHHEHGLPWPLAAAVCLGVAAPLLGIVLERLGRALAGVAPALQIVATVGLLLLIQGLAVGLYGSETRFFPRFLPTRTLRVAGANVGVDQLLTVVVAGAASLALAAFLRRTRAGIAMRGVVDNPALLDLAGWSPTRIRRLSWVIGAVVATASGILIAPAIGLDALLLTLLIVQAFGAAAIGRFSSLPLTYAGGLVVGVAAALLTKEVGGHDSPLLSGLPPSVPFVVLFGVLVATPARRFGVFARRTGGTMLLRGGAPSRRSAAAWAAAAAVAVIAIPGLVGPRLPVYTNAAAFVVVFAGMLLLVNLSGQVSLCQASFAALGATTFSHLAHGAGLPWLVALLGAGLVTVPLGAVVAVPAIRLSGLYLALATFGLGVLLDRMVFPTGFMFGVTGTRVAPRPGVLGLDSDVAFFYLVALIAGLSCAGLLAVRYSRLGRLLGAMGDAPVALATVGVSVNVSRVLVFCLSAFLTGVAGALFAAAAGSASAVAFAPLQSLVWLAVLVAGGTGLVKAPLLAAVALAVVPAYLHSLFADWGSAIFGAVAIVAALRAGGHFGIDLGRAAERWSWRADTSPVRARMRAAEVATR